MLYNSDYWGCLKLPKNNPIENMHMRFCKEILGVQRQTTHVGVLLELGRITITTYGMKSCMKNYSRIHILEKANKLVLSAHLLSLNCALKWTEGVKSQLNRSGVGSENRNPFLYNTFFKRISDTFHQDAFTTINREESKLRTFGKLKTTIGISPYLTQVKHLDSRKALSKVRLSNHDLMIEKGCHLKIDKTQRFCPFCPRSIETELYFLLHCKTYRVMWEPLCSEIQDTIEISDQTSDQEKINILLSNVFVAPMVGNFLHKALSIRKFLLSKPKNRI